MLYILLAMTANAPEKQLLRRNSLPDMKIKTYFLDFWRFALSLHLINKHREQNNSKY